MTARHQPPIDHVLPRRPDATDTPTDALNEAIEFIMCARGDFIDHDGEEATRDTVWWLETLADTYDDTLVALKALLDWGRDHTSPTDPASPHPLLVAAKAAIDRAEGRTP